MRLSLVAAVALAACWSGAARADGFCLDDLSRQAAALVQSLVAGGTAEDREVIKAPGSVDTQMAVAPPEPRGAMRVIRPRADLEQR